MSYKLEYPYTEQERMNFIVEYNHTRGLRIETVDNFVEVETSHYEPNYGDDGEIIEEYLVTDTVKENHPTYYALESNEIFVDGEVQIDPEYEEKEAKKEAERIAMLKLTRGDVFRGLLQAKGITRSMLRATIEAMPEETQEQALIKEMALIDFDEALDFYRGNALIDTVGLQLGITKEQLDAFFEDGDYTKLL